jgi:hypothetical protein
LFGILNERVASADPVLKTCCALDLLLGRTQGNKFAIMDEAADGAYRAGSRNNAIFDSSLESHNYIKVSAGVGTKVLFFPFLVVKIVYQNSVQTIVST